MDFEERTRTGPANVLFGQMLPELLQRGVREFDHLGGISDYKTRWGALARTGSDVLVSSGSLKGRLLDRSGLWPTSRFMIMDTPGEPRLEADVVPSPTPRREKTFITEDTDHTEKELSSK